MKHNLRCYLQKNVINLKMKIVTRLWES